MTRTRHDELLGLAKEAVGGILSGQYLLPDEDAVVIERGEGAYAWDVRGRRFIDCLLGSGPVLLGHGRPEVTDALTAQLKRGTTFYALSPPAIELAARIVEVMPCAEQVRFTSAGSDATFHALRMARTFTGRQKVLKFGGAYHGTHDLAIMNAFSEPASYPHPSPDSAGVSLGMVEDVIVSRWNDVEMTAELVREHADDLAAVICEPIQRALPAAPGFLQHLRDVTRECGVLLVLDEMVTGFRFALGGAQERYGVVPDLATFGKAVTNGMPLAGIAGRRDVIGVAHPRRARSDGGFAFFGGTLNGNPLCAAAGIATLGVLSGPGVYPRLEQITDRLTSGLRERVDRHGLSAHVLGDGPLFQLVFAGTPVTDVEGYLAADREMGRAFGLGCLRRGVLNGLGKFYVSLAHTDQDVEEILDVFDDVLAELAREGAEPATA